MSDHRHFYVISSNGEAGPLTADNIKAEVAANRIQRTDLVRTAFGANLGTVEDVLNLSSKNQEIPAKNVIPGQKARQSEQAGRAPGIRGASPQPSNTKLEKRATSLIISVILIILFGAGTLSAIFLPREKATEKPSSSALPPTQMRIEMAPEIPQTRLSPPIPTPMPPNRAHDGQPQNIPGIVEVWRFNAGGEGIGYHDQDQSNNGGYPGRPGTGVDLANYEGHGVFVCYVADGEWVEFACTVAKSGLHRWSFLASHDAKIFPRPGLLVWTVNGEPLGPPVPITDTGGFRVFTTFTGEVHLNAGTHNLRLYAQVGGMDFGDITFSEIPSSTP